MVTEPKVKIVRDGRWLYRWTIRGEPGWERDAGSAWWEDMGVILDSGYTLGLNRTRRQIRRSLARIERSNRWKSEQISLWEAEQ